MEDTDVYQEEQPKPKLKVKEFAAKIKAKYPQYKDIDDTELTNKIIAKYPDYKEQVDFSVEKKNLAEPSNVGQKPLANGLSTTPKAEKQISFDNKIFQPEKFLGEAKPVPTEGFKQSNVNQRKVIAGTVPYKKISEPLGHPKFNSYDEEMDWYEKQDKAKGEGNFLGHVWNTFTNAVGGQLSSAADLKVQLELATNPALSTVDKKEVLKQFREQEEPKIRSSVTEKIGTPVSEERVKDYNDHFVTSSIASLAGMVPAMVGTKGSGFVLQAYDGGLQSINSTETGKNLPESYKTTFAASSGLVMGLLTAAGIDKILGKQTDAVATKLAAETMANLIKTSEVPVTKEMFEAAMQKPIQSLKEKIIAAGGKVGRSAVIGGTFGAATEAANVLAENITNKVTGKQVFDPKSWGEEFGRIAHASASMAFGMGALGLVAAPFSKTRNIIKEKVAEAKTPEDIQALRDDLVLKAQQKGIRGDFPEQVDNLINEYAQKYSKMPLTANNKPEIADKMEDRDNLEQHLAEKEQELQTVDPAFQKPIIEEIQAGKGRIEELNDEMVKASQEPPKVESEEKYNRIGLTDEANALLEQIDNGIKPDLTFAELHRIAKDNYIENAQSKTHQEIIKSLKEIRKNAQPEPTPQEAVAPSVPSDVKLLEYDELPQNVKDIVDKYGEANDKTDFNKKLEEAGYGTDYSPESFGQESDVSFYKLPEQLPSKETVSDVGGEAGKDVKGATKIIENGQKWYKAEKQIKDKDGNILTLVIDKNKDDNHFYIKAKDSKGNEVGSALFETSNGKVWSGNEIEVKQTNRRKGIMSAIYDFAESEGHPLEPTKTLSKEGTNFWENRKQKNKEIIAENKIGRQIDKSKTYFELENSNGEHNVVIVRTDGSREIFGGYKDIDEANSILNKLNAEYQDYKNESPIITVIKDNISLSSAEILSKKGADNYVVKPSENGKYKVVEITNLDNAQFNKLKEKYNNDVLISEKENEINRLEEALDRTNNPIQIQKLNDSISKSKLEKKALEDAIKPTTTEANKPIQQNEPKPKGQGTEESLQPSPESTGTGKPKEAIPVLEEGSGKEPPSEEVKVPVSSDGKEMIGISHAQFDKVAEELGLPLYEKDPQTIEQWHEQADKRLAKGEMPKLIEKLQAGEIATEVEQFMIGKYVAGLKFEWNKTKSDAILKEIKLVKELSDKAAGAAWGRSGRARQEMMEVHPLETGDLASAMVAKMEANNTDVLTDKQKAEVAEQVEKYKKAAEEAQRKTEEADQKNAELLAQIELEKLKSEKKKGISKTTTKKTHEDFKKERKDITESIREKLRKARGESNVIVVPYAKELITIAPDVLKLAKSYLEEGIVKLSDIVTKAHDEMKQHIPEITERDIRDIISGKYNERKETKNELKAKWYELQQEQKLLNELHRVNSFTPKTEKEQRAKNERLTALRQRINTVKKENKLDQYSDEAKLKNLISSNERAAKKLQERINDEDFEPEKPLSIIKNLELKKKFPKLYFDVLEAINKKEEARHEFDIALAKDKMAKESKASKALSIFNKAKNTTQQITAGVDDSLMFVQLGHTLLVNPGTAINFRMVKDANGNVRFKVGGALKEHFLDAWSKKRFDANIRELHNMPVLWPMIKASRLDVLEPQSLLARQKEEMFQHSYAGKIGIGKANLGKFLEIFERAYTSLGNNVRVDLFRKQAEVLASKGMTIENNLAEFQDLAKAINNLTGRGTTNAKLAQLVSGSSPIIWSPKMIASSINLLGLSDITGKAGGFYSKLSPEARKYALKQMSSGIAIGASVMAAAALGGATVHPDPTDRQFGEVEFGENGEKSFNVFGRFAGYIKLIAQMTVGRRDEKGKIVNVYAEGGKAGGEVLGGFFRGKFNPVSGITYDYLLNDKKGFYDKKPITLSTVGEQLFVPMSLRAVNEQVERDGAFKALEYIVPNFTGIQMKDVRDYDDQSFSPDTNTFIRKHNIKIDKPSKDKEMTDGQYETFVKRRNERLEHDLTQLKENGLKSGNNDDASIEKAVKLLTEEANKLAKMETFEKTYKEPEQKEYIKNYKPMKFKRDY